jgi:hypothetical protein
MARSWTWLSSRISAALLTLLLAACQNQRASTSSSTDEASRDSIRAVSLADSAIRAQGESTLILHCVSHFRGGYFMTYIDSTSDSSLAVMDGVHFVGVSNDGAVRIR